MARPLYLSNSYLSVCVDEDGFVRDIYYPHVGLENHVGGFKHRIGIQIDGQFSWLDEPTWQIKVNYQPRTLVGETIFKREDWQVEIHFQDCVYNELPIFLRHIKIVNCQKQHQEIKIFFGQEFAISESKFRNTAFLILPRMPWCTTKASGFF